MRAQVFHGPGDLRYEDCRCPSPSRAASWCGCEAALTCGTDVKTLRRGHPVMIPHVPTVFGHELAGVVTAVGARRAPACGKATGSSRANSAPVRALPALPRPGRPNLCEDLLFVNGAYGEYIALPPRLVARNLVPDAAGAGRRRAPPSPSRWPAPCSGSSGPASRPGMTVVIFGHGPLGCLLALAARRARGPRGDRGQAGWRLDRVRGLGLGDVPGRPRRDGRGRTPAGGYRRAGAPT